MKGILLVDKDSGWTSSDVVVKLKGLLRERRVGHAGTLDPMATGLLTVFVGRATRAAEFAESHDKRYIAGLRLGLSTDTQDITGRELKSCGQSVSIEELESALAHFRGELSQLPPMYSAVKVGGQRLYDIARRGGEAQRRPRSITVSDISVAGKENGDFILDISCSKGTYVRTLCNDIGEALGCGGCMSSLRRVRAGCFSVEDALTIAQIRELAQAGSIQERLLPVDTLFRGYGETTVSCEAERLIRCGTETDCSLPDGRYRVYSEAGEFLMLGQAENGRLKTVKSFFEV